MRVLAVDTSSEYGSVSVTDRGEVVGEIRLASSIQHSERLFHSIEFLFHYLPFQLHDIDIFAAACGPGSFTGLRVGIAAMEGFAAANSKRAAGVTTDRKSTRLNSSHQIISYAVFCLKKKIRKVATYTDTDPHK